MKKNSNKLEFVTSIRFDEPDRSNKKNGVGRIQGLIVIPTRPIPLGEEWEVSTIDKEKYLLAEPRRKILKKKIMFRGFETSEYDITVSCGDVILLQETVKAELVESRQLHYGMECHFKIPGEPEIVRELNREVKPPPTDDLAPIRALGGLAYALAVQDGHGLLLEKLEFAKQKTNFDDCIQTFKTVWISDGDGDMYPAPVDVWVSSKSDAAVKSVRDEISAFEKEHSDYFRLQDLYEGELIRLLEERLLEE